MSSKRGGDPGSRRKPQGDSFGKFFVHGQKRRESQKLLPGPVYGDQKHGHPQNPDNRHEKFSVFDNQIKRKEEKHHILDASGKMQDRQMRSVGSQVRPDKYDGNDGRHKSHSPIGDNRPRQVAFGNDLLPDPGNDKQKNDTGNDHILQPHVYPRLHNVKKR